MDTGKERRSAPRIAAYKNSAQVRWSDPGHGGEVSASVVDISWTGALIACSDMAPPDDTLWVRLREPGMSDWVSGNVARHVGAGLLAVAFHRSCPPDLLWCATTGVSFGNLLHDLGDDTDDGRSRDDWMF